MARQTVNTGSAANDNTGDTMRTAGTKINANFTEIYTILGGAVTAATKIKLGDSTIIAEGASANDFETTVAFTDPTADRTITFPDATGTVQLTGGTQSLTSAVLTTPQIQDTNSSHQYIFAPSNLTADRTVTLPLLTGNDEFVFKGHTQTLTNKTLTAPTLTTPKFADAGFIADAAGNEQIVFQQTSSAVNSLEVTNAATNSGPSITSVGGDTHIPLLLAGKGTGAVLLNSKVRYKEETLTGTTVTASPIIPLTIHNASSSVACTLADGASGADKGFIKKFININSGAVTITPGTYGQGSTIVLAQHETASLIWSGASWYSIGGDAPKFLGLTAGTTAASKVVTTDANGDFLMPDADKARLGTGGDMTLFHDGTNSFLTNATGAMKIATETSGIVVTIGHTTSETTVADNLSVTGNATVGGVLTGLTVEATGDTAAGDNAAIGYTAAEGLILTGQGSTNDVTIKNDADADVIEIPTGTTNVNVAGNLTVAGNIKATDGVVSGKREIISTFNTSSAVTGSLTRAQSGGILLIDGTENNVINLPAANTANVGTFYDYIVLTIGASDKTTIFNIAGSGGNFFGTLSLSGGTAANAVIDNGGDALTLVNSTVVGSRGRITCLVDNGTNGTWQVESVGSPIATIA